MKLHGYCFVVYHSDNEITVFFIKSWNTCIYFVYFKSKKELNYDRFADPNILSTSRLVRSDLRIYRISFFLLGRTDFLFREVRSSPSSSIQLSATGRLLDITYMCYEFRTPLLPGQLTQPKRYELSVTSTLQSWIFMLLAPLLFVQASHTPVVKVRPVVWWSDLMGQGGSSQSCLYLYEKDSPLEGYR